MTATEILNMSSREISEMTTAEIKSAARIVFKAANQRATRVKAQAPEAPAIRGMEASGGSFKLKGKNNINQIRAEFYRAKQFMQNKTSTIKGAKEVRAEVESITGGLSKAQENKMWKTYNKLKEMHPELLYRNGRYDTQAAKDLQRTISGEISKDKRRGVDYILNKVNKQLEEEYEEYEEEYGEDDFSAILF